MEEIRDRMCDCVNLECRRTVPMNSKEMLRIHQQGLLVLMPGCKLEPGEKIQIVENRGSYLLVKDPQYMNTKKAPVPAMEADAPNLARQV